MGAAAAVDALLELTTVMMNAALAAQRISAVIKQAQTEGRDLTAEETAAVRAERETAMQRWDAGQ